MPNTAGRSPETVNVQIEGVPLTLSNLDKVYFPESGITKGELIRYYTEMAPYILPHIQDSPFTMVRYPEGINGEHFYQKECPGQAPPWVTRYADPDSAKGVTYAVCDHMATLVYLINLGCIEIHAWASTVAHPDYPAWAVFDLDPDRPAGFNEALRVAVWLGEILHELKLKFLVKTSGATGVHVLVPLQQSCTYAEVQRGMGGISRFLAAQRPQYCTVERSTKKREGKVYLDYLQNGRGRTMAGIYSVRPTRLGNVSTPLTWGEVIKGVSPGAFHIRNFRQRLQSVGDLTDIMQEKNNFSSVLHYFT